MSKISRNSLCPCGSKRKYKKCCGLLYSKDTSETIGIKQLPLDILDELDRHKARERIREKQQGLGNSIVSMEFQGFRVVGVGNKLYWSKYWKTFIDFLFDYLILIMGTEWIEQEYKKDRNKQNLIIQWYEYIQRFRKGPENSQTEIVHFTMIGIIEAYLRLSYHIYNISHNLINNQFNENLRNMLIGRLKHSDQFPGAYYECFVNAALVRAGYEVEFVDETDGSQKHYDYKVTQKRSQKVYSVEAKAINREGALGASQNISKATIRQSIRDQLYDAFSKPSEYPRIIFIELNLVAGPTQGNRQWLDEIFKFIKEAEDMTVKGTPTEPAYVFLTNHSYHYYPSSDISSRLALPVGYKINDFGYGCQFNNLREAYFAKQKHKDVYEIFNSIKYHFDIPSTFDGSLPSETFPSVSERLIIGETYNFEDIGENGLIAKVTSATVNKVDKAVYIGTDQGQILMRPMSDIELSDYEKHPDEYFGIIRPQGRNIDDPLEMFEKMLSTYSKSSREHLISLMQGSSDIDYLNTLTQEELSMLYCERCVYFLINQSNQKQ